MVRGGLFAAVAVGLMAAAAACGGGGSQPGPTPSPHPPDTATATPTAAPSTTPAPPDQPEPRGLTEGEPVEVGSDSVVYYGITCAHCGGELNLWRAHRVDGALVKEQLLPGRTGYPPGSFYTFAAAWERGEMYVGVCIEGYCGPEGEPSADSRGALLRSIDGGLTWTELGPLPRGAFLVGLVGVEEPRLLVRAGEGSAGLAAARYYYVTTGGEEPVSPPAAEPDAFAFVDHSRALSWRSRDGERLYDAAGAPILLGLATGALPSVFDRSGSGALWATWRLPSGDGAFGRFRPGAAPGEWQVVESWTGPVSPVQLMPGLSSVAAIAQRMGGPVCIEPGCVNVAIVRLDSGTIHPFPAFTDDLVGNSHPYLAAIVANAPYATVNTPRDCLNLRDRPSLDAPTALCIADRVLVIKTGEVTAVDGRRWAKVRLWDGREGWVAEDHLLQQ